MYYFLNFRWANSNTDPLILSANAEGSLKGYSVVSGTPRFEIQSDKPNTQFLCFDLDSDSSTMVIGDNHGDLLLYDRLTLKMVHRFSRASWFSNGHFNRVTNYQTLILRYFQSNFSMMMKIVLRRGAGIIIFSFGINEIQRYFLISFLNNF